MSEFSLELQSVNAQFRSNFFAIFVPCDLKFNRCPRKIIGHLLHTTSSFVHHFKSIGEFKLELQYGDGPETLNSDDFDKQ